ncbi:MAG: LPXTG cell wall anchor domain-containing protein [Propionibacteriales bacterium]|nr:LPXTG cell wall anchor domain-containing protein [Propionibacteriales bacterium]
MKKLIVIGVTTLAALFVAFGFAPSANAYPQTSCKVTINAQKVFGGTKLKVSAEAQKVVTDDGLGRAAVDTTSWIAEFNGVTKTAQSDSFAATFNVPEVDAETVLTLRVQAMMAGVTPACEQSLNITVLPGSAVVTPPGGTLPNTGGPHLSLLIGGLGLVAAGSIAIRQSRRSTPLQVA